MIIEATQTQPKGIVLVFHRFYEAKEYEIPIAYCLARRGYVAVAMDAADHGEREAIVSSQSKFDEALRQTPNDLIDLFNALQEHGYSLERITTFGTSLGGMIALSCAVLYEQIRIAVSLLGSGNFEAVKRLASFHVLDRHFKRKSFERTEGERTINPYDPYFCPETLAGKKILLLNGKIDTVIPIELARDLHRVLREARKSPEGLCLTEFSGRGHIVTPEMREYALDWLDKQWDIVYGGIPFENHRI